VNLWLGLKRAGFVRAGAELKIVPAYPGSDAKKEAEKLDNDEMRALLKLASESNVRIHLVNQEGKDILLPKK
jgi:hypothetical protein